MKDKRKKITIETLIDAFENRLEPELAVRAQAVAESDPEAREVMSWLHRFTPSLRDVVSSRELNPSPAAVAAVQQLFRDRLRESRPASLPVVVARLVFDSRRTPLVAGVRGERHANFQVVYSTDAHDVDLWQERLADGNWYLIGQILPKDGGDAITPRRGALTLADEIQAPTQTRDGEFFIAAAQEGCYDLQLDLSDSRIVMHDVCVGAQVA